MLQASKAAVHSMCETLHMELAPFGISVVEVWAGTMKTDINSKVAADLDRAPPPPFAPSDPGVGVNTWHRNLCPGTDNWKPLLV